MSKEHRLVREAALDYLVTDAAIAYAQMLVSVANFSEEEALELAARIETHHLIEKGAGRVDFIKQYLGNLEDNLG